MKPIILLFLFFTICFKPAKPEKPFTIPHPVNTSQEQDTTVRFWKQEAGKWKRAAEANERIIRRLQIVIDQLYEEVVIRDEQKQQYLEEAEIQYELAKQKAKEAVIQRASAEEQREMVMQLNLELYEQKVTVIKMDRIIEEQAKIIEELKRQIKK